jgi:predicted dehydrogenase
MKSEANQSRRAFLGTSAAIAGGAMLGAAGAAAAQEKKTETTARAASKDSVNDAIHVALIGTGGRCRHLGTVLRTIPGVRITAVCDVYDPHLAEGRKLAEANAFATKQFKEILDRKDIDAVLIATPDHWHVPITVAACEAGKDVYVEKPLTHDLSEGRAVIEAQNKHRRIVQVGMQQRSMPHIAKGAELIKAGRLGEIHKIKLSWNRNSDRVRRGRDTVDPTQVDWKAFLGNAPEQPFDGYRMRNWRWFWDFGGGIFTDLMVHWIDVAHWLAGLDNPKSAVSIGEHYTAKDVWETPDTVQTLLVYPGDIQAHFEGTFCNARYGARIEFMGTKSSLYIDRGRYELVPERNQGKPEELILGTGNRGQDFYDKPDGELLHLTNWVECMRSRKTPTAPAEAGVQSAAAAHLANKALRAGGVAKWEAS